VSVLLRKKGAEKDVAAIDALSKKGQTLFHLTPLPCVHFSHFSAIKISCKQVNLSSSREDELPSAEAKIAQNGKKGTDPFSFDSAACVHFSHFLHIKISCKQVNLSPSREDELPLAEAKIVQKA
jgi:hypothetical protein